MKYESAYADQRMDRRGTPWVGHLKYRDPQTGRWRQVSKTFGPEVTSRRRAERALAEWRAEMEVEAASAPALSADADADVADYVESFVAMLETAGAIERSTAKSYAGCAKRIREAFGGTALRDLTPQMVQAWHAEGIRGGYSPRTVNKWHRLLSEACRHAVATDALARNPCAAVRAPKGGPAEPNSLTMEQYARLAATLSVLNPSPTVTAAAIALHCGLRVGEICGIRWREYDAERRTIHVVEAIGSDGGDYSKRPKTLAGTRDVPVPEALARTLEARRAEMRRQLQEAGVEPSAEEFGALYVIGYPDGRHYSPTRVSREFKGLAEALDLVGSRGRRMTMHGLRDSYATLAIAAGADVRSVSGVLGHSSPAITMNVYADALPEGKRRASELLAASVAAQGNVDPLPIAAGSDA